MTLFWVFVLVTALLLYVLLDGFDLGVGILFGFTRGERERQQMMDAIAPVWDGNETWLVMTGAVLFAAFPVVYAVVLSAFYLPLFAMLGALILRGVAFEFRHRATRTRWIWDWSFAGGSLAAAFIQGVTVGALVHGIPVEQGRYVGTAFGWLSPFALLSGIGLCFGYALLGAGWLILKCDAGLRSLAYRLAPVLMAGAAAVLLAVFVGALQEHLPILQRWLERPWLAVFPAVGAGAAALLVHGLRRRIDRLPFLATLLVFAAAFVTFAASFWPYMVPFSLTIAQAAAPATTLSFMFWGIGVFVFPLTLIYTAIGYRVFRGKLGRGENHYAQTES
ncbi:MAG: cytochrome d ubiquinol oxidase subunit II [Nevskia sp.]|nr:cytochrome d ubiquinol oxidase subunit II [Nevskia sp.]